jgi:hypothetical protein
MNTSADNIRKHGEKRAKMLFSARGMLGNVASQEKKIENRKKHGLCQTCGGVQNLHVHKPTRITYVQCDACDGRWRGPDKGKWAADM